MDAERTVKILQFVCRVLSNTIYRLEVSGRENIPSHGPAVIVCNHVSFVDWMLLSSICRRPIRFVMHHGFFRLPLAGRIFRDARVIPIASALEDPALLDSAFRNIASELRKGELVCYFPEGRLTRNGKTIKFRPGIERIVRDTPVPVVPVCLKGLWGSFFSRKYGKPMSKPFRRFWSRVSVIIGKPVPPREASAGRLREIVNSFLLGSKGCPSPVGPPAVPILSQYRLQFSPEGTVCEHHRKQTRFRAFPPGRLRPPDLREPRGENRCVSLRHGRLPLG